MIKYIMNEKKLFDNSYQVLQYGDKGNNTIFKFYLEDCEIGSIAIAMLFVISPYFWFL